MGERVTLTADTTSDHTLERIDSVASDLFPQYSRALLQRWIKSGELTLNGKKVKPSKKLVGGERLAIDAALDEITLSPEPMELDIVFEDDALLVLNKPAGLVVHPGAGNPNGTLLNGLLHFDERLALLPRAGLVHRLDKDTTGLMVVARTNEAYRKLVELLAARQVSRGYEAIVYGTPPNEGSIDKPIARHKSQRTKMAVVVGGREAVTHFQVLERFGTSYSHVAVQLETGRTHQIRVHMQYIGFPLVGDPVYGGRAGRFSDFGRQALHAKKLAFVHPVTGEKVKFVQPLPEDIEVLLDELDEL